MSLKGKTALITGSTSGIGLAIAKGFAAQGTNIILNGFGDKTEIANHIQSIEAMGVQAIYAPTDMTDPAAISSMMDDLSDFAGGIDILINNAGTQFVSPIEEFPPKKWDLIIALNLSAAFHTTRLLVPKMRQKGWGRIINMCSAHGIVASPYKSAYVAAKHGIIGLTKTIALEVAQDNITCNAICPGYVDTPLVQNQIADTAKARNMSEKEVVHDVLLAAQWTKKFVKTDQISDLALFLCSDSAENITGADLRIDGGWTAA